MTYFWLDPAGRLWCPHYKDTHLFEIIEEDDPRYDEKYKFLNYEWIPTGKHGVYRVHKITKYIEIYPADHKGEWEDWPTARLHFVEGLLQDFKIMQNFEPVDT